MKAAVLFADAHHTLHLVNVRIPEHKPTADDCERAARAILHNDAGASGWQYIGTLKNGPLSGPIWHDDRTEGKD